MRNSMCTDLASHNKGLFPKGTVPYKERLLKYKKFAVAFSYPDAEFLTFFPEQKDVQEELFLEYDRLFRNNEVWLYSSEHKVENEFQRAQNLADINGFYRAFGLETNKDRPDALSCELEFMHYLIFKELNAPTEGKFSLCHDAQRKFFNEHLYPAARKIAQEVVRQTENKFYREISRELEKFLEKENEFFRGL